MEAQGPGRPEDVAEEDTGAHQVSEFTGKILEAAEHSQTAAPLGAHPVDALPLTLASLLLNALFFSPMSETLHPTISCIFVKIKTLHWKPENDRQQPMLSARNKRNVQSAADN